MWILSYIPPIYPIHLFAAACILTVVFYMYIYLSNPFWCRQPVVHTYDWWRRWFALGSGPKILYDSTSKPTKYYFPEKMQTFNPVDEPEHLTKCAELLQNHYIAADNVLFSIQVPYLSAHFIGHNDLPPLVSLYYELAVVDASVPQAMIAAIPVSIYSSSPEPLPAYFWNFMCVHREYQSRKLIRPLIQTHEYRQREATTRLAKQTLPKASIFRCDVDLQQGVVPLTRGYSYTYYLRGGSKCHEPKIHHVIRIDCKSANLMNMFTEYILSQETKQAFEIYMTPSLENLVALMEVGILYVYALAIESRIVGVYFFKNVCTTYESLDDNTANESHTFPGSRTIHCFASINSLKDPEEFGLGFASAVKKLVKASRGQFNVLILDGNNEGILAIWNRLFTPFITNEYAYYAYNWRVSGMPIPPERCFTVL